MTPDTKSDSGREQFNGLLTRLGGLPMAPEDHYIREPYLASLTPDQKSAYYAAHSIYSEHEGDMDKAHAFVGALQKAHELISQPSFKGVSQ